MTTVVLRPPAVRRRAAGAHPGTRRLRGSLAMLGPAFVAGIAYVDPGNVATNFDAGTRFGYRLLWVVLGANLVAALMQSLAAKLGLATGRDLAELCAARFSRPTTVALWAQAEVVALATDLAEIVGGALALNLLFGLPLPVGAVATAAAAYVLLLLRDHGRRRFEVAVAALFVVIAAGFCYDAVAAAPSVRAFGRGLAPGFAGTSSIVLATAIVGATVMPHAVYVHSALAGQAGVDGCARPHRALWWQRVDIGVAMGSAGLVNVAMIVVAAAALTGVTGGLPGFHAALGQAVGGVGALLFVIALLASGLASSGVGTFAGEVIMAGYLGRSVPRPARRIATLAPALTVLLCGMSATDALVVSQVVLGLGIPFALVPLVRLTSDRQVMGDLVNRRVTTVVAALCALAVVAVDAYSLQTLLP